MKTKQYKKLKTLAWWYLSMQIAIAFLFILLVAFVIDLAVTNLSENPLVISDTRTAFLVGAKFLAPLLLIVVCYIVYIVLAIVLYIKLANFDYKGSFDTARTLVLISIFVLQLVLASIAVANIYRGIKEDMEDSDPEDYIEQAREIKNKQ
ncbi:hypothetical protein ACA758_00425 [Mycoplasmopsis agassizii]|uniref:hypothetical protein n=1 Tax=Mycoplasmopsis agassizii TaxID=33922 RepID=UPI003528E739